MKFLNNRDDCNKVFSRLCSILEDQPDYVLKAAPHTKIMLTSKEDVFCYLWAFTSHFIVQGIQVIYNYHEDNIKILCHHYATCGDELLPLIDYLNEVLTFIKSNKSPSNNLVDKHIELCCVHNEWLRAFQKGQIDKVAFFNKNLLPLCKQLAK